jgi:predicted ATPase
MIDKIQLRNFKSVVDASLELGAFNVLIGENGCGKSNLLEGIALGAAATADKLDFEFLGSRGIRIPNPEFMYSAFAGEGKEEGIQIRFQSEYFDANYQLVHDAVNPKKWSNKANEMDLARIEALLEKYATLPKSEHLMEFAKELARFTPFLESLLLMSAYDKLNTPQIKELARILAEAKHENKERAAVGSYAIFSPEQSSLRRFEDTTQIYPLGIRGEGLFQYLKAQSLLEQNTQMLAEIKENLHFLDWYEDFHLPVNLLRNEFSLHIKDRYLDENLQYFDQRSTNEGFLYLLFYLTLFISKETPGFFAIDNIDAAFNPKMCARLTEILVQLAKKHGKQVIVTTHHPSILDGLDLNDEQQRLFVVRRNSEGHTIVRRIAHNKARSIRLSEAWTNGFIGGLPDNF